MATFQQFYPSVDSYNLTLPAGLTKTQTAEGGTAYIDTQGNPFINNGSGFQYAPQLVGKLASSPIAMNGPVAPPTTNAPASSSGTHPDYKTPGGQTATWRDGLTGVPGAGAGYYVFGPDGKSASYQGTSIPVTTPALAPNQSQTPAIAGLPSMGPGSTGQNVKTLQNWLVSQGYMTQDQMNTGPGTYGPQTTAAVAAWQKAAGIDTKGNSGYFGPISQQYLASQPTGGSVAGVSGSSGGTSGSGTDSGGGITPTGNPTLDSILSSLQGLLKSGTAVIPAGLQITPALTQQFLAWAHQVVDPQTQQLIQSEITNINASSKNLQTQYENNVAETEQQFGTNLATEQNSSGASGTAFSGLRNLTEGNMAASTNRSLASLASDAAYNIGSGLRTGAANVGSTNAGGLLTPSLGGASVSQFGGSRGTTGPGGSLNYGYDPSLYTAGIIPSNQNTAVNQLAGNYLSQYGTLAGANSGRSMSDLIGGISGLPAGYQLPASLS